MDTHLTLGESLGEEPFILLPNNVFLRKITQIEVLEKSGLLIMKFEDWQVLKSIFSR